ncbi:unnamed protein product, partial [Prorocentrum cordatum]
MSGAPQEARARGGLNKVRRVRRALYVARVGAARAPAPLATDAVVADDASWLDLNVSASQSMCMATLGQPPMSLGECADERDQCCDPLYQSTHASMRVGFWEGTDRLKDAVPVELFESSEK